MSGRLRYAVHAYAWTSSWSSADLPVIDHVRELGLDAVEIPLMEPDEVDPAAIAERAQTAGVEVVTSLDPGRLRALGDRRRPGSRS